MVLVGVCGNAADVNRQLLQHAISSTSALVIDCGITDISDEQRLHSTFPISSPLFVADANTPFTFYHAIAGLPTMTHNTGSATIIITSFAHLFRDEGSGAYNTLIEHAWIMLSQLATQYTIIVGVQDEKMVQASKYCHKIVAPRTLC